MTETNIPVTSGSGNAVDVFSLPNSNLRQSVVVGDSAIAANVAPVQSTDPSSNAFGLVVRDVNSSAIVSKLNSGVSVTQSGTFAVYFDQSAPTVRAIPSAGTTFAVSLDPGHLLGSVTANAGSGTMTVAFDPGHTLGSIVSVGSITNTVAVFFSPSNPSVSATFSAASIEVIPTTGSRKTTDDASASQRVLIVGSQSNASLVISGTVTANAGSGTMTVAFDPGHTVGNIGTVNSITNTVAVFFSPSNPAVSATFSAASIEVIPTTGSRKITDDASAALRVLVVGSQSNASLVISGTVTANAGTGTMTVTFDPGHELGTIKGNSNTLTVFLPDTGHEIGTIRGNTNTLTVFLPDTGHTLGKVDAGAGTFTVKFDPGYELGSVKGINSSVNILLKPGTLAISLDPGYTLGKIDQGVASSTQAWLTNSQNTSSIFTVSGSTSGVSVSGVNLVAPSASYNFKVFAYSIQTTAVASLNVRFVNGSGASQTEFWRPLVTAASTTSSPVGANMAVPPPSFIFATGTNTSLNIIMDTGALVHYSVSYIKESA